MQRKEILFILGVIIMGLFTSSCTNGKTEKPKKEIETVKQDSESLASNRETVQPAQTMKPYETDKPKEIKLFEDMFFDEGFSVFGEKHETGKVGEILPVGKKIGNPKWRIAQWACKNNIALGEQNELDRKSVV